MRSEDSKMEGGLRTMGGCKKSTTEMPLVSVITVVLNGGKDLEQTVLSVINQSYENIEYIIIDGGSTDRTLDIIKKYEDRIDYWLSEPDKGISDAFNKGIRASKGDIIGIINAGDRYAEGSVKLAVKVLFENPDYDFVYGNLIYIDMDGNPQFLMKADRNYKDKLRYTMPALHHPTVFIKRDVYDTCGLFDTCYKVAMDYEFFLRIASLGEKGIGIYVEKTLALMALRGISYTKFYNSYKEVCRASIKYGYNPLKAHIRLYLKGLRGLLRVTLEILRLNFFVKILRKVFWDVNDVKN